MTDDGPIIEWDERLRSVLVSAVPTYRGPEHMAATFEAAARLIREGQLQVRGVALFDTPEGLVLFCDREDGAS